MVNRDLGVGGIPAAAVWGGHVYGEFARIAAYLGGRSFQPRNSSGVVIYRSPTPDRISLVYAVIQYYHTVDLATYYRRSRAEAVA